jgi:hypothetical protein
LLLASEIALPNRHQRGGGRQKEQYVPLLPTQPKRTRKHSQSDPAAQMKFIQAQQSEIDRRRLQAGQQGVIFLISNQESMHQKIFGIIGRFVSFLFHLWNFLT